MSKVSNEILKTEKRVNDLEGRRSAAAADLQKTLGRIVELRDQRKLAMVDGLNTAALDLEIRKTEEDSERKTDLVDGLIDAIASSEAALADLRAKLVEETGAVALNKFKSVAQELDKPLREIAGIMTRLDGLAEELALNFSEVFWRSTGIRPTAHEIFSRVPRIFPSPEAAFEGNGHPLGPQDANHYINIAHKPADAQYQYLPPTRGVQ